MPNSKHVNSVECVHISGQARNKTCAPTARATKTDYCEYFCSMSGIYFPLCAVYMLCAATMVTRRQTDGGKGAKKTGNNN